MAYQHFEDIDVTGRADADLAERSLITVINRTINALQVKTDVDLELRQFIASVLQAILSTHKSIRLLLKQKDQDIGMCADGVSPCREQVEKIFVITLILDDPNIWLAVWFKYDWRKKYEEYLLQKRECQNLDRFRDFLDEQGIEILEGLRKLMGVSDLEKEAVEFRFDNPGNTPLPTHLGKQLISPFPTPGHAIEKVKDATTKPFLDRWYWEWKFLCDYSHIGPEKLLLPQIGSRLVSVPESAKERLLQNETDKAAIMSYLAALSCCTEVYRLLSPDIEVLGELTKLWKQLTDGSLLGKVFWEIRAKHLFPPLI